MQGRTVLVAAGWLTLLGCMTSRAGDAAPAYDGRNLYLGHCAACHGETGAGDGPVASAMAAPVPDLRKLEARHGDFPSAWLREVIDGRAGRAAHGPPDMPVWGWRFRLEEASEADANARIDALVTYVQSIQLRGGGAEDGGPSGRGG